MFKMSITELNTITVPCVYDETQTDLYCLYLQMKITTKYSLAIQIQRLAY
jgi:hypothetical protein